MAGARAGHARRLSEHVYQARIAGRSGCRPRLSGRLPRLRSAARITLTKEACMSVTAQLDLLVDARNHLGEGVLWCELSRRVYWTDITAQRLHSFCPASGVSS